MNELFYNITDIEKEKILTFLEANTIKYKKNTTILDNQKNDNIIGIIIEGYIQIIKTDYNGNKNIIEDIQDGAIFGTTMSSIKNTE